jgi:hypothetical protein
MNLEGIDTELHGIVRDEYAKHPGRRWHCTMKCGCGAMAMAGNMRIDDYIRWKRAFQNAHAHCRSSESCVYHATEVGERLPRLC